MRNRYSLRYCIFTLVVLVLPTIPAWADLMLTSTVQRTAVLELYTSEGCSSCPPADRWLHQFTTDARLWREIVPLAFHVDYWDYLGWRDRFAHPEHTTRQQTYAAIGGIKTVYTPGLVLNGREWRGWFERRTLPTPPAAAVGVLTAQLGTQQVVATFTSTTPHHEPLQLNLAWLGFDIVSNVTAGENGDRKLEHDFVVLTLSSHTTLPDKDHNGAYRWQLDTQRPDNSAKAVAMWVSRPDDPTPLQAVGGWLESAQ